jgi:hypothetical protein
MARSSIARLNQIARRIVRENGGDAPAAIVATAAECSLEIHTIHEAGILFRSERNKFAFGWTNGSRIEHGGCGFDNQID